MNRMQRKKGNAVCASMAVGAAGGLLGAWVMNQFQAGIQCAEKSVRKRSERGWRDRIERASKHEEPATLKVAEKVSETAFEHRLNSQEKKIAEPAVHYAFGALIGAIYGGLAEVAPETTFLAGMGYGAAVWLLADEIAVPAAGLSKSPRKTPWPKHVEALGAHLVYGLTTEGTRRLFRLAIPA
jgi:uncharacterized membrane protein YagU involved in acid resistance